MRVWRSLPLFLAAATLSCLSQQPANAPVVSVIDGGQSGAMESIFVPPKAGAPFSFTLYTEWTRPLGNGGTFTLTNQRRILRDGRGRIYQERAALVPKGGKFKTFVTTIQITDPEQHTRYNCDVASKTCDIINYRLSTTDNFVPARIGNRTWDGGSSQDVDLGVSSTLGEDTHGYRETQTINPGISGNDQPMVSMHEYWYSARLALNLLSTVDTPLAGHQVFTARDLTTSEPDPTIFNVPTGYTVTDHRADDN
jgi:hypothetical protein